MSNIVLFLIISKQCVYLCYYNIKRILPSRFPVHFQCNHWFYVNVRLERYIPYTLNWYTESDEFSFGCSQSSPEEAFISRL